MTITISEQTARVAEAALRYSLPLLASMAGTAGEGWDPARAEYRMARAAHDELAQALRGEVARG